MSINDEIIDEVVASCRDKFRGFGGRIVNLGNPISIALADQPATFAAGVDIRDVVKHVLSAYNKARYMPVDSPDDTSPSPAGVSSKSRE